MKFLCPWVLIWSVVESWVPFCSWDGKDFIMENAYILNFEYWLKLIYLIFDEQKLFNTFHIPYYLNDLKLPISTI